jgi:hypothetical protein
MRLDFEHSEREHHAEFLRLSQDIARNALDKKRERNSGLNRYQHAALDFFVHIGQGEKDFFKQAMTGLAKYSMLLKHFALSGSCIVASYLQKHLLSYPLPHIHQQSATDPQIFPLFDRFMVALPAILARETVFCDFFPVPQVYDNPDR